MLRVSDHWLGTEASLAQVLRAIDLYEQNPALYPPALRGEVDEDEDEDEASGLLQVQDGIGFLFIDGPLTAEESWLDKYFGITSYPAVARAAIKLSEMYQQGDIYQIIHAFSTPGGDANGINGLTEVLQAAKAVAPDTISYTGSQALSAGYWLATINDKLYVDKMAEVGSVGVVSTVRSIHRMLQEDGVDVKVIRSGKYKALLHPYEPLSEAGLKEVERKGKELHQFFYEHITAQRPVLQSRSRDSWAEGQTFFGQEAVSLGLADGPVITLNALVQQVKTRHNTRDSRGYAGASFSSRGTEMPKHIVFPSPAEQAAVASGADLAAVEHTEVEELADTPPTPEETFAEVPAEVPTEGDGVGVLAFLRDELKESRTELESMRVKLALLEQEQARLAQVESQLAPIAREAINKLQIALRQSPTNLSGLPAEVLAVQYADIKAQFERVMPVGRRSLAEAEDSRTALDAGEQRLYLK